MNVLFYELILPSASTFPRNLICFHKKRRYSHDLCLRPSLFPQPKPRQAAIRFPFLRYPFEAYLLRQEKRQNFERQNYLRLMRKLKCGDLLVIKSIDRLGRNYDMIIEEWSRITNKIRADILVLDMPLLDTHTKPCSLVGKFISDIVLQILSFVAENEWENTRTRQAEGVAEAKRKGVRFGRPPFRYSQAFLVTAENYYRKAISLTDALLRTNMTRSAFYYHFYKLCNLGAFATKSHNPSDNAAP